MLASVLYNVLINGIDSGTERTFGRFADNTMMSGAFDTLEGRNAIQRNLVRVEEWAYMNLMKSNKARSCTWLRASPSVTTDSWIKGLRATLWRKIWGYLWMKNWKHRRQ